MAYVQLGGRQYPLAPGENGIGRGETARVPLGDAEGAPREMAAMVVVGGDGDVVIRRVGASTVRVNGVQLGAEPTPLIHGDKIEIGQDELFFGDDRRGGNTQFVVAVRRPEPGSAHPQGGRGAAGNEGARVGANAVSGGRLVSLVDGREYAVSANGLVLGRDPTCDVVVPTGEVSRRHAVIAAGPDGYSITDTSTNGLSVNGSPVSSSSRLVRGDVITIGAEDFRFYADAAPPVRPVLATLEVKSTGLLHGSTFEIRSPLAHIGRGPYNDVVLSDDSVSDVHAKLQRRPTGWVVVDMASTNGTYVGGRRIVGEAPLEGAPDLRVGGIKFIFRPSGSDAGGAVASDSDALSPDQMGGGAGRTRAIAALTPEQRAKLGLGTRSAATTGAAGGATGASAPSAPSVNAASERAGEGTDRTGRPWLFWVVLLLAAVVAVFLLLFF